jgi:hypothetical protein
MMLKILQLRCFVHLRPREVCLQVIVQFLDRCVALDQAQHLRQSFVLGLPQRVNEAIEGIRGVFESVDFAFHRGFPAHVGHFVDMAFDPVGDTVLTRRIAPALNTTPRSATPLSWRLGN